MNPYAVALVATERPLSVTIMESNGELTRVGGNRYCWPCRTCLTSSWKDTISADYDKSPFVSTRVQFRVWTRNLQQASLLEQHVRRWLSELAEEGSDLRSNFVDAGPDIDWSIAELHMHQIGKANRIETWDDDGLIRLLDDKSRRAGLRLVATA